MKHHHVIHHVASSSPSNTSVHHWYDFGTQMLITIWHPISSVLANPNYGPGVLFGLALLGWLKGPQFIIYPFILPFKIIYLIFWWLREFFSIIRRNSSRKRLAKTNPNYIYK